MYTLQILDAGQTFLHPMGEQAVSFGSSKDAHVRLSEESVSPIHARLIPHADGVRLIADPDSEVVVNGVPIKDTELQLGDRIELGQVVMIVGRTASSVARTVDVEDVSRPRVARSRSRSANGSKLVPILAGMALLAVIIALAFQSDDSADIRGRLGDVKAELAVGDFDGARQEALRLRRDWAGSEDDRLVRLEAMESAIDKVEVEYAALVEEILDATGSRKYADWFRDLKRRETDGGANERIVAHKVLSRLRQMIRQRDEERQKIAIAARPKIDRSEPSAAKPVTSPPQLAVVSQDGGSADVVGGEASKSQQVATGEVDQLCRDGFYTQALAILQAGFSQAPDPAAVQRLRGMEQSVRQQARAAMDKLLGEARGFEQGDRLQHAVALLQGTRHHFPSDPDFVSLAQELSRLEEKAFAAEQVAAKRAPNAGGSPKKIDAAIRLQTLESLRGHMVSVRKAEDQGDYAQMATLLRDAADGVRARDAGFADRLNVQADEAAMLAEWNEAIAELIQQGKQLTATDRQGREVQLHGLEGLRIIARSATGEAPLDWHDLDVVSMRALAKEAKATGRVALGLSTLLYQSGDVEAAEAVLADLLRGDGKMQSTVDRMLARGRGDSGDTDGYVLRKGEFVSLRQIELDKRSKQLLPKLAAAMRAKDSAARDQFVAATLAQGDLDGEALMYAMRDRFAKLLDRVGGSSLRKQVDKLVVERDQLDAARQHAKDLIYDSVRYFYPYRPPAVSGEKHAEYNRVQAEVNDRVAALRAIWNGSKFKLRVPQQLDGDIAKVDWLALQLSRLGGFPDGELMVTALAPIAWARALDAGQTISLQTFCMSPSERAERGDWHRVEAYNKAVAGEFSVAVRSLLRITNDYRAMFGHRPLAAVKTACAGSQGHADEMSKLGYFSHMSPVPSRRTPHDRMKIAGYMFGVSENIAMTGGAQAAHNAWCGSSGHHRNLLMASHHEIGIGANGRYWVQNFGSGKVYKTHSAWASLKVK